MKQIYEKMVELLSSGRRAALVSVISASGSTPRETGSKMIVEENGHLTGTVGGGPVEARVIENALEAIRMRKSAVVKYSLDDREKVSTGMICGGTMEFFIEPLVAAANLYIFGAGHIALPLFRICKMLGFSITVADDRKEFASPQRFPEASSVVCKPYDKAVREIDFIRPAFVVIITRCHETDEMVLRELSLSDRGFDYIGSIASKKKALEIRERLKNQDVRDEFLNSIHSPIGISIHSRTPEEIAVSIAAELISIKNAGLK